MAGLNFPTLDALIAKFEGYGVSGSRAQRNNNPGNLQYGPFAQNHGATGSDAGGFAQFPDVDTGYSAMDALVGSYANRGYNINDMIAAWNGHGANTQQYQDFVSRGVTSGPPSVTDAMKAGVGNGVNNAGNLLFGVSFSRMGAFLVGLICIGAALWMFGPSHDIIVNSGKAVAKTAAIAA